MSSAASGLSPLLDYSSPLWYPWAITHGTSLSRVHSMSRPCDGSKFAGTFQMKVAELGSDLKLTGKSATDSGTFDLACSANPANVRRYRLFPRSSW